MAIWNTLLSKLLTPSMEQVVNQRFDAELEKSVKQGMSSGIMRMNVPAMTENNAVQKNVGLSFQGLRDFSVYYPVVRACINRRKQQITQLVWDITTKEVDFSPDGKHKRKTPEDSNKTQIEEMKHFLKYPTGDKTVSFTNFVSQVIEDLLAIDAVAIYRRQKRGGGIYGYLPVDGGTIQLRINPDGTTPHPPQVAYIQKVQGKVGPVAEMTTDELLYLMMNPRSSSPYGLALLETLIITVTTALKLQTYNLSYLSEGNVPEGFIELPREVASSRDQLKEWQDAWDAMLAGDPRYQRKLKFLPEGMKYHPTKQISDMAFDKFEKWLLLNTCAVFGVPPQDLGFTFETNRSTAEIQWEVGKERGLFPLAQFLKEMFDQIIQEDFGFTDLEFVWVNINPMNKLEEAKVFDLLVRTGAVSVDEWRIGEGMDPIGLPHYIMTPVGPIFVKDLVESSNTPGNAPVLPYKPGIPDKVKAAGRVAILEELKKWKKVAYNDVRENKRPRNFSTMLIDVRTKSLISKGLESAQTKEDIDQLFDPLINSEHKILTAVMDLYDDITGTINGSVKSDPDKD